MIQTFDLLRVVGAENKMDLFNAWFYGALDEATLGKMTSPANEFMITLKAD